jgi:hypothetical protein
MGQSINIPRQDGNARFDTLRVKLIESSSLIRTVVADNNGKFYYSTSGGGGGTTGTNGTSGTSGINGANGTNGTSGTSGIGTNGTSGTTGTSGTSGTGFNTINNAGTGRILLSDGTVNAATASSALVYNSNELIISGSTIITGSLTVIGHVSASSFTGSLLGTASHAVSASYATTASYALFAALAATASYIDPANLNLTLFQITTGRVTASVNVNPNNLFLIKSGSTQYFNISSSGDTDLYSNLFIVRNFTTQQPVLIVSQSIVQIQTQSLNPTGATNAGSIWFTSSSFYVGLE